jgi:signal transduction histidine kinase
VRQEGEHGARLLTYAALAIPRDQRSFALEISETLSQERTYPLARVRRTLLAGALTLLACGAVAWGVGVRLVGGPVARLVAKARRIGSGDFSEPLALPGRDEFSLLAAEMNAMAEQLDAAARRVSAESAQRIAALEQLRHADRLTTVGKLASGLAHELGTPLNVVSGRAEMIASGEATTPEELTACARIVCQQAERMTGIVRQLLDFGRRRVPEKSPTDVAQLARQTANLLEPLAGRRSVNLCCVADAGAPLVAALDASQVQQALTNLVVNAIQASKAAGTVRLDAWLQQVVDGSAERRRRGGYAVLEVSDDGEGIPAERLGAIFDPFFTTKGVGEGTGLGLSVAHGIVDEHDGWIEVESAPGSGSCFRIWLPVDAA